MVFALQHISYYSIISMTVSVPAMDDPLALRKLLGDCLMSSIIIEHIIGLGYTTISMIHSTIPTGEDYQPFSPQSACIRRAIKECMAVALDSGRSSTPEVPVAAQQRARLSAAEAKELKDQFSVNYPWQVNC